MIFALFGFLLTADCCSMNSQSFLRQNILVRESPLRKIRSASEITETTDAEQNPQNEKTDQDSEKAAPNIDYNISFKDMSIKDFSMPFVKQLYNSIDHKDLNPCIAKAFIESCFGWHIDIDTFCNSINTLFKRGRLGWIFREINNKDALNAAYNTVLEESSSSLLESQSERAIKLSNNNFLLPMIEIQINKKKEIRQDLVKIIVSHNGNPHSFINGIIAYNTFVDLLHNYIKRTSMFVPKKENNLSDIENFSLLANDDPYYIKLLEDDFESINIFRFKINKQYNFIEWFADKNVYEKLTGKDKIKGDKAIIECHQRKYDLMIKKDGNSEETKYYIKQAIYIIKTKIMPGAAKQSTIK